MRIACFTMQKNEGSLLESWAAYHGSIFGYNSLFILDNISEEADTKNTLARLEHAGANVSYGYENFELKGQYATSFVAASKDRYDWLFLLDTDEFLYLPQQLSSSGNSKQLFEAELTRVPPHCKLYRICNSFWNIPYSTKVYKSTTKKVGLRSDFSPQIDLGFHMYTDREMQDPGIVFSGEISHLHFHNRKFPELLKMARLKLSKRVKSFDREHLAAYSGAGSHLTKYFTISEMDYMEQLTRRADTMCIGELFRTLGVDVPHSH